MTLELVPGLLYLEDDRPELGVGEVLAQAVELVPATDWAKLLKAYTTIRVVDDIASPPWAEGKWNGTSRVARVVRQFRPDGTPRVGRLQYIGLHEVAGHGSDEDVLTPTKRTRIRQLMDPTPSSWVDDEGLQGTAAYWWLPSEVYANRLVEALTGGIVRSPFDDDYRRWIPDAKLDELVAIVTETAVGPTPPPVQPPPTPTPTARELELMADVARLEARIVAGVQVLEGA